MDKSFFINLSKIFTLVKKAIYFNKKDPTPEKHNTRESWLDHHLDVFWEKEENEVLLHYEKLGLEE